MDPALAELRLPVGTDLAGLERIVEQLDEFWAHHELDPSVQADLNIAIEEMLSNVMRHNSAGADIQLQAVVYADKVKVEIRDRGRPFDPLAHPAPDVQAPLEQRRGGGLGIFLTIRLMDETSYERVDGENRFRMERQRRPRPAPRG